MNGGEERIGIGRQVDSSCTRLQLQDRADERRVLMRESIVLLSGPRAGFDIVDAGDVVMPCCLSRL